MSDERTGIQKQTSLKRWLLTAGKVLVVVLVFWFVRHTIYEALEQLAKQPLQLRFGWLAAAAGIYLLGLLPAGVFWHRLMITLGQDAGLGETLRAYYIGHLGKYVPGKAMVVVIRAGLIRSRRVNTGVAGGFGFLRNPDDDVRRCLAGGWNSGRLVSPACVSLCGGPGADGDGRFAHFCRPFSAVWPSLPALDAAIRWLPKNLSVSDRESCSVV